MKILSNKIVRFISLIYLHSFLITNLVFSQVNVTYDTSSTLLRISVSKLEKVLIDVKSHDIQHPAEEGIFVLSTRTKTSKRIFSP